MVLKGVLAFTACDIFKLHYSVHPGNAASEGGVRRSSRRYDVRLANRQVEQASEPDV